MLLVKSPLNSALQADRSMIISHQRILVRCIGVRTIIVLRAVKRSMIPAKLTKIASVHLRYIALHRKLNREG